MNRFAFLQLRHYQNFWWWWMEVLNKGTPAANSIALFLALPLPWFVHSFLFILFSQFFPSFPFLWHTFLLFFSSTSLKWYGVELIWWSSSWDDDTITFTFFIVCTHFPLFSLFFYACLLFFFYDDNDAIHAHKLNTYILMYEKHTYFFHITLDFLWDYMMMMAWKERECAFTFYKACLFVGLKLKIFLEQGTTA